jgi:restriction system protein
MSTSAQSTVPRVVDLFVPTIQALKSLGGSASIEEIDESVADILAVSDAVREQLHNDGPRTKLEYRCAWARSWLKAAGLVANSDRGVWALTAQGDAVTDAEFGGIPQKVRHAVYEARKKKEQAASIEPEEDLEDNSADWKEQLLDALISMSAEAFERLAQRILRESGFTRVQVTGKSKDRGIDGTGVLRMNLLSFHVLFQCKRWQGSVGSSVVRDFRGAMQGRADKGLILTTGTFSAEARREATRDGAPAIDLIDGEALCELLKELRLGVVVKQVEEMEVEPNFFKMI